MPLKRRHLRQSAASAFIVMAPDKFSNSSDYGGVEMGMYKRMGKNQKPKAMPVLKTEAITAFLRDTGIVPGKIVRISKRKFENYFRDVLSSLTPARIERSYKDDQTQLSGEVIAMPIQYTGERDYTLKVYTGRPDEWDVSAYTVLDLDVISFKYSKDVNVRKNAVCLDHQKPQRPYDPSCRSPHVSSNMILSGLAYDQCVEDTSLSCMQQFSDFNHYIDERLMALSNLCHGGKDE